MSQLALSVVATAATTARFSRIVPRLGLRALSRHSTASKYDWYGACHEACHSMTAAAAPQNVLPVAQACVLCHTYSARSSA